MGVLGDLLIVSAFTLGLRHGVDWDHIAAITDITSSEPEPRRSFLLGTLYALGHATVVMALGFIAVEFGQLLPDYTDRLMEPLVGITLMLLAVWVFYSLLNHGENFRLRSRWMLLLAGVLTAYDWVQAKVSGNPRPERRRVAQSYGTAAAYGIGMVHGVGAETASQVLLFVAAAGAGGRVAGSILVAAFVIGLLASNSGIILASVIGFKGAQNNRRAYMAVGALTGVFSLILGSLFILGQGSVLPAILT